MFPCHLIHHFVPAVRTCVWRAPEWIRDRFSTRARIAFVCAGILVGGVQGAALWCFITLVSPPSYYHMTAERDRKQERDLHDLALALSTCRDLPDVERADPQGDRLHRGVQFRKQLAAIAAAAQAAPRLASAKRKVVEVVEPEPDAGPDDNTSQEELVTEPAPPQVAN